MIAAVKSVRGIWNAVVHARKHTESDVEMAGKGRHIIKEPAAIANVRLALGIFMGSAAILMVMYNAIRMHVCASAMLVSTRRPDLIDHAVNCPRRVDEGQGGALIFWETWEAPSLVIAAYDLSPSRVRWGARWININPHTFLGVSYREWCR